MLKFSAEIEAIKTGPMNWNAITRFNFTYAMEGGAWIEDSSEYREWVSFPEIIKQKGQAWLDAALKKQGFFTGCWVTL